MLQTHQSDSDDASQPTEPKAKNYLQGTLTKISANASLTVITIHLKEKVSLKEEEDAKEYIPSQSTSSKPSLKGNQQRSKSVRDEIFDPLEGDHLVKLHGSWCRLIAEDLKIALNLKVYLDCHEPELDLKKRCWEFRDGLRADLFIHNSSHHQHHHSQQDPPETRIFCKKIDLGPIILDSMDDTKMEETAEEEENDLRDFNGKNFQKNPNHNVNVINSVGHKIKQEDSLGQKERLAKQRLAVHQRSNPHKRSYTEFESGMVGGSNSPDSNLETVNPPLSPHSSHTPDLNLTGKTSSTFHKASDDQPGGLDGVKSSKEQKFSAWKTLDEIDKMVGGVGERFNVMGIIKSKKTDTSMKATGGSLDYNMTLYLMDGSLSRGSRGVTCNLFSRSELEAPPWLSANWAVVMLFNVYKRKSETYPTQIVGPALSSDWAVWCPAYLGSAERLESSFCKKDKDLDFNSLMQKRFNLTGEDLKKLARQLHQDHSASESHVQTIEDSQNSLQPNNSIPKSISELRHGLRHPVDLCVKIVDVWIDAPGNDRLTVTDFTSNQVLKVPQPRSLVSDTTSPDMIFGPVTPIVQFHVENGGDEMNWRHTQNRLMSVYVAQPILQVLYNKLQGSGRCDRFSQPYQSEIKSMLTNKLFKLNQVDIRVRAGSSNAGVFYGVIDNPLANEDSPDLKLLENLDDLSYDLLASKIMPFGPSDPYYRPLLRAQESYRLDLQKDT